MLKCRDYQFTSLPDRFQFQRFLFLDWSYFEKNLTPVQKPADPPQKEPHQCRIRHGKGGFRQTERSEEAISILAMAYEKKHFALPKPDPIQAIKERMAQLNLSQKDVAPWFGGENRVSEVLSGKRGLTVNMIRALHKYLQIPAETLLNTDLAAK